MIEMLTTPVKSIKSVVMRSLGVSETVYLESIQKIQKQTSDKPGPLFRGSFTLIISLLREVP